jgi:hypothetical protein
MESVVGDSSSRMEDMEVEQVVNPKETPWPEWHDHWKCDKKSLGKQAEANRTSGWVEGFGTVVPVELKTTYYVSNSWDQCLYRQHQIVSARKDAGFFCELCGVYASDHAAVIEHCRLRSHEEKLQERSSGVWGMPGASSGQIREKRQWSRQGTRFSRL